MIVTYKSDDNTIIIDEGSDFSADLGVFYIHTLKQMANEKDATTELKSLWNVIETWLDCKNRELSKNDDNKIAKAWKAYYAIGNSPSLELQPAFDMYSKKYREEGYCYSSDKAPSEVMDVFDKLMATDEQIEAKRKSDFQHGERNKLGTIPKPKVNKKVAPSKNENYPKILSHLQTKKGRFFYAMLLGILIMVSIMGIPIFIDSMQRGFFEGIVVILILTSFGFGFLTIGDIFINKLISNWKNIKDLWHNRKDLRLLCFGSLYWAIGVFLYVAIFDPYHDGSWKYMDDWGHMFSIMIAPPFFIISAILIYQKYIK